MSITVIAKRDLEGYILETTITVNIPKGTTGQLVNHVRNDIVIVQFDVPSLGALRVNRNDLIINNTIESVVSDAERIINTKPFIAGDVHRALDDTLIRALELLVTDDNKADVQKLIQLFKSIPKQYHLTKTENTSTL
ncbi:MAG: hypothetical protein WBC91_24760 [Phototrophicaceae bacterium]